MKSKEEIEKILKDLENHKEYAIAYIKDWLNVYMKDEKKFNINNFVDFIKYLTLYFFDLYKIENQIKLLKKILEK